MPDIVEALTAHLTNIIDAIDRAYPNITDPDKRRMITAFHCGYVGAKLLVRYKETYGLPLCESAQIARRMGLKIDWGGLKVSLQETGMDANAAQAETDEARNYLKALDAAGKAVI